jgi:dTDP-4-dehydrorhamnose reductase
MRIALIGASGQVATELARVWEGEDLLQLRHEDIDIVDVDDLMSMAERWHPAVIVNTAAFHKVDLCEDEPERAFGVNALGAWNCARAASECGALFVHFSTDYVFSGTQDEPYGEDGEPSPINVYGWSKAAGEHLVRSVGARHLVVRTSGVFGPAASRQKGGNFVDSMIRLAREGRSLRVVSDQVFSPTSAADLADKVRDVVHEGGEGIWHITNSGRCSWFELAEAAITMAEVKVPILPVSTQEYGARASRPGFSVLAHSKLESAGMDDMPHWRHALGRYLELVRAAAAISA